MLIILDDSNNKGRDFPVGQLLVLDAFVNATNWACKMTVRVIRTINLMLIQESRLYKGPVGVTVNPACGAFIFLFPFQSPLSFHWFRSARWRRQLLSTIRRGPLLIFASSGLCIVGHISTLKIPNYFHSFHTGSSEEAQKISIEKLRFKDWFICCEIPWTKI